MAFAWQLADSMLDGKQGYDLQAPMPKQYMTLRGQPIATHSLDVFAHMPEVGEVVVVCEPSYRCATEPTRARPLQSADVATATQAPV